MNEDLLKIIDMKDNTLLSELKEEKVNELIKLLDNYCLCLRNSIGLFSNDTVGFEFEFEDYNETIIQKEMDKNNYFKESYKLYPDGYESQSDFFPYVYEVCTPVLNLNNINWNRIKELCYILKRNSTIGSNCGAHIHVGAQILNNNIESLTNFIGFIIAYENIIARFLYGNFINERLSMHTYAPFVAKAWYDEYSLFCNDYFKTFSIDNIINILSDFFTKKHFINLANVCKLGEEEVNNTIEFRGANGTLDPVIWQNNCNLIIKLMKYCNSNNFDKEKINNRIEKNYSYLNNYKYYLSIDLKGALEFSDLVFNNNLDKMYFLRQYLKDRVYTDSKILVISKKFTETKYNDNDIV